MINFVPPRMMVLLQNKGPDLSEKARDCFTRKRTASMRTVVADIPSEYPHDIASFNKHVRSMFLFAHKHIHRSGSESNRNKIRTGKSPRAMAKRARWMVFGRNLNYVEGFEDSKSEDGRNPQLACQDFYSGGRGTDHRVSNSSQDRQTQASWPHTTEHIASNSTLFVATLLATW